MVFFDDPRVNKAERKAKALLRQHMSAEQRAQAARTGYFIVKGSAGGVYRLASGNYGFGACTRIGPCHKIGGGPMLKSQNRYYCIVQNYLMGYIPASDVVLARMLLIETNEKQFLEIAR